MSLYKYGAQGFYGDNPHREPPFWEYENVLKWHAWSSVRGMGPDECAKNFLDLAEPFLVRKGHNIKDP